MSRSPSVHAYVLYTLKHVNKQPPPSRNTHEQAEAWTEVRHKRSQVVNSAGKVARVAVAGHSEDFPVLHSGSTVGRRQGDLHSSDLADLYLTLRRI